MRLTTILVNIKINWKMKPGYVVHEKQFCELRIYNQMVVDFNK